MSVVKHSEVFVLRACSLWAGYQLLSSSGMLARIGTSSDDHFPGNGQRLGGGAPRTAKHKPSFGIAND